MNPTFNKDAINKHLKDNIISELAKRAGKYIPSILNACVVNDDWEVLDEDMLAVTLEVATYLGKDNLQLQYSTTEKIGRLVWIEKRVKSKSVYSVVNGYSDDFHLNATNIIDDLLSKAFNKLFHELKFPTRLSPGQLKLATPGEYCDFVMMYAGFIGANDVVVERHPVKGWTFSMLKAGVPFKKFTLCNNGWFNYYNRKLGLFYIKQDTKTSLLHPAQFSNISINNIINSSKNINLAREMRKGFEYIEHELQCSNLKWKLTYDSKGELDLVRVYTSDKQNHLTLIVLSDDVSIRVEYGNGYKYVTNNTEDLACNIFECVKLLTNPDSARYDPSVIYNRKGSSICL